MSTLTITIPCATNPFPNNFCLIYGDSDCATLCINYDPNGCGG